MKDEGFSSFQTARINGWFYVIAPNGDSFGFSLKGAKDIQKELTEFINEQGGVDS